MIGHKVALKLPGYAWDQLELALGKSTLLEWFRIFWDQHRHDPIVWPSEAWLESNGELVYPSMASMAVVVPRPIWQDLQQRAAREPGGPPMVTVLRRLVCQHFGRTPGPSETVPHYTGL